MFKLFVQLFIIFILFTGCNNTNNDFEKKAELKYLDTLDMRLTSVKGMLDKVDLADIQERQDIIANNYKFCNNILLERNIVPETETVRLLDEYKALGLIYESAISNYKPIVMKLEELLIEVKTLKESANDKNYNKETFKLYFNKEKEDILRLTNLAETKIKPCIETESIFEKRQNEVEELSESLKK